MEVIVQGRSLQVRLSTTFSWQIILNRLPEIVLEGFKLVDEVIIPHYDNRKYAPIMKVSKKSLRIPTIKR